MRLDAVWRFSVLSWVLRGDMDTQTVGAMETLSAMLTTGALPFARRGRRCGRAFHMALMFILTLFREEALAMFTLGVAFTLTCRHLFSA